MDNWKSALLPEGATIADAIRVLEASTAHICLVVDDNRVLKGTITDGDVRRGILRALPLSASAREVMKATPITGRIGQDLQPQLDAMRHAQIRQLPLLDGMGRVVGLTIINEFSSSRPRNNWVVLMAGGLGLRLRPFTEKTPKPMLTVGAKPLLETTIESFLQQNFGQFYISVNYLADKVRDCFGNGSQWGCNIRYLEEKERLGTAGPLSLLPEKPDMPIIVMNGDLLTKVNFGDLLEFHQEHGAMATMCVRQYDFQVPYGVVDIADHRITRIIEKPIHKFFVNAGIYVLDPAILDLIPHNRHFDMTELFDIILEKRMATTVFPIREYWMDIGRLDDFERANGEFDQVFGQPSDDGPQEQG